MLHVGLGGIVSGMTLAVPPAAVVLLALPFSARLRENELPWSRPLTLSHHVLAPLAAVLLLTALALTAKGAAALLARCSPNCSARPPSTGWPPPNSAPYGWPCATGWPANCTTRWATRSAR